MKRCPTSPTINEKQVNAMIGYISGRKANSSPSWQRSEETGCGSINWYKTFGKHLVTPNNIFIYNNTINTCITEFMVHVQAKCLYSYMYQQLPCESAVPSAIPEDGSHSPPCEQRSPEPGRAGSLPVRHFTLEKTKPWRGYVTFLSS